MKPKSKYQNKFSKNEIKKESYINHKYFPYFILACISFLLYSNTLTHQYALDDRLLITENEFTKKGILGIPEILTNDAFTGFFGQKKALVAGGRYRPLTQIMFAIEYQIFGLNPFIGHLVNVILYTILVLLLFHLLRKLFHFETDKKWYYSLAFISSLIFAVHPIHTEVVANIKGRDEILSLIGALVALWFSVKYVENKKIINLFWIFLLFLIGVFAKENALTFLAIIPFSLYFFYRADKKEHILVLIPLILSSTIFMIMRHNAVGGLLEGKIPAEILNNPFINVSYGTELGTVIYTWAKYLILFIFPHPLTHDYYPYQIEYHDITNPLVIFLIIVFLIIMIYSAIVAFRNNLVGWAVWVSLITFSVQSNLLFNIGTFMNERFLFAPSVGLSILLSVPFYNIFHGRRASLQNGIKIIILVIVLAFSVKTITRNLVWENDHTLFLTDVKTSKNSIKCNVSAGGSSIELAKVAKTEQEKNRLLREALEYLKKAQELHRQSFYAWLLSGNAYSEMSRWQEAHAMMQNALNINPESDDARNNMLYIAQQSFIANDYETASKAYLSLYNVDKNNDDNLILYSHSLSYLGKADTAIIILDKIIERNPENANAWARKGEILGRAMNNMSEAENALRRSLSINPEDKSANENLGIVLAIKGNFHESLQYFHKALSLDSTNANIYRNISSTYMNMNQPEKAAHYNEKFIELSK